MCIFLIEREIINFNLSRSFLRLLYFLVSKLNVNILYKYILPINTHIYVSIMQ